MNNLILKIWLMDYCISIIDDQNLQWTNQSLILIDYRPITSWLYHVIFLLIYPLSIFSIVQIKEQIPNTGICSLEHTFQKVMPEEIRQTALTHSGLVLPPDQMNQHLLRKMLIGWQHKAITWTNVVILPFSCGRMYFWFSDKSYLKLKNFHSRS